MEENDIKKILLTEFVNDPIYRLAMLNGLEDSIFTEGILSLHKDLTYSTVETGRIIERSDSTIRNHFRSDLIDYITPEKFGKFYRLNYQSVFRLHLIFLLMDKAGKTTVDILAELGVQPAISVGGNIKRISRDRTNDLQEFNNQVENYALVENRFLNIEHIQSYQDLKINTVININKFGKELAEVKEKITEAQSKIKEIKFHSEIKFLEEKQSLLVTNSLKNSLKETSFFGLLKKNNKVDIQQLSKQIDETLKEKYEKEVQSEIKKYESKIEDLLKEKESIEDSLKNENKKLESPEGQIRTQLLNNPQE